MWNARNFLTYGRLYHDCKDREGFKDRYIGCHRDITKVKRLDFPAANHNFILGTTNGPLNITGNAHTPKVIIITPVVPPVETLNTEPKVYILGTSGCDSAAPSSIPW